MNRRIALGLLVVLLVIAGVASLVGGRSSRSTGASYRDPAGSDRSAVLGIAPGSGIFAGDADQLISDLDAMIELGSRWIRLDIDWARIEPERGQLEWTTTDEVVRAAHDRGFRILGLLTYTPSWARPPGTNDKYPPSDPAAFARFAAAAAERYRNEVEAWEIWNEPNTRAFWAAGPEPEDYAALLTATASVVRAADPTAIVLSGGLAPAGDTPGEEMSPERFLDGVLGRIDGEVIDAVAIHPYSFPADPSNRSVEWNLFARLPAIRRQVAETVGRPLPVWLTEFGAPHDTAEPERQAEIIAEGLNCAAHWTWVGPVFVYSLRDAADDPGGRAFGMVGPNGEKRPAWGAVRRFSSSPWSPTPSVCASLEE